LESRAFQGVCRPDGAESAGRSVQARCGFRNDHCAVGQGTSPGAHGQPGFVTRTSSACSRPSSAAGEAVCTHEARRPRDERAADPQLGVLFAVGCPGLAGTPAPKIETQAPPVYWPLLQYREDARGQRWSVCRIVCSVAPLTMFKATSEARRAHPSLRLRTLAVERPSVRRMTARRPGWTRRRLWRHRRHPTPATGRCRTDARASRLHQRAPKARRRCARAHDLTAAGGHALPRAGSAPLR
jgi:hypothetical protein